MHELTPDTDPRTVTMHPIDPEEGVTPPSSRLELVKDFLHRNPNLTDFNPLERTIIEQALGLFLVSGRALVDEVSSGVVTDPPHDIRISEVNEQDEVVSGIIGLKEAGVLNVSGIGREGQVIFDPSDTKLL